MTSLSNYMVGVIRTVVGIAVGAGLALVAKHFPGLAPHLNSGAVNAWLFPLVIAGYYMGVHWLEIRWPKVGLLLGLPIQPNYQVPAGDQVSPMGQPTIPDGAYADDPQPSASTDGG